MNCSSILGIFSQDCRFLFLQQDLAGILQEAGCLLALFNALITD